VHGRRIAVARPVLVLGGCLLLGGLFLRLGPAHILSLLTSLGWNYLVIVALFAAHECVRAVAIRSCLPTDSRPALADLLRIRFLGEAAGALTRTGPFAAEPTRAWLLANMDRRGLTGYSAAIGELMANTGTSAAVNVAVTGWALLGADLRGPAAVLAHVALWGSLVYLSAIVGTVVSHVRILETGARVASRLPIVGRRLRMDPEEVQEVERAIGSRLTSRPAALPRILLLETLAQAILVCETYWAVRSMGVGASAGSALFIEVMTRTVSAVQLVGATEVGFAVVFTWLGMPAAVGFTLSLVKTLRSLTAAGIGIGLLTSRTRLRETWVPTRRPSRGAMLDSDA
jgi:hypothetical protein